MKKYYQSAVVDVNSWSPVTGNKCVKYTCGHEHRTLLAATRCYIKHLESNSADWSFSGRVIDQDETAQDYSEAMMQIDQERNNYYR